jgi:CheY-like chemotaxis protein
MEINPLKSNDMATDRLLGPSVLVVEDDPTLRELYRAALQGAGYAVVAVDDGLAALRYTEQHRPDAVVLDLALPRLGGRDVFNELRSRSETRRIPVVVVTGTDTSDLDPKAFASLLVKPVPPDTLISVVERSLRSRSAAAYPV